ncbi:tRNA epoxyqueuosine(34) reductase QueG [Balneolaceae bacterium ANBcel3]|nr:tRNA epoxyqueuosine(34) reductase QueG [Balneolaceae bacterium ANBcel3]
MKQPTYPFFMAKWINDIQERTRLVRAKAKELGFESIGISKAGRLVEEESRLEQWLKEGMQGSMAYMENHFDKRLDPTLLVPGARSVLSVLLSYHQPEIADKQGVSTHPKITKYALGEDYHFVVKEKLFQLYEYIASITGEITGRAFVDSAPVMDKAWAVKSGLGWMGKHTNLINREWGSWFFLGEIISDVEFEYDQPINDHCGTCTRCIDACPTQAIYEPYKVDGSRCISYLTIELREEIPEEYHEQMGSWIFGCDICQDVCPWNRRAGSGAEERLFTNNQVADQSLEYWEELDLVQFRELFRKSAVKRTKYRGLQRNIGVVKKNLSGR